MKYQDEGPWAGWTLKRPIGFAPWPTRDEYEFVRDVEDTEAEKRRRQEIMSLPENPEGVAGGEEF